MVTDDVPLVDHHCHGVVNTDLDRGGFESLLTEAPAVVAGRSTFDSLLGLALRRWCAPVLGLPAHVEPVDYLERRAELGWQEAASLLLRASGTTAWFLDTGFDQRRLTGPAIFAELAGGNAAEVVRLETVAEEVAAAGVPVVHLWEEIERAVRRRAQRAVGLKTVVAYRCGLDFPIAAFERDLRAAAESWLRDGDGRLTDRLLLGRLVELGARIGAELGLPLQFHTGFGDPHLRLQHADPLLLTDFLTTTADSGTTVMLLHCWPFHRNAGYLAHVFSHVYIDVGLAVPHVGARAETVLAELIELAPFGSLCFSSDGYGLPELHYLGATLWRHGLGRLLDRWIAEDVLTSRDAERLTVAIAHGNAERAYRSVAGCRR